MYREAYKDVSQNFEGGENFMKQWIKEICEQKKVSVEEVFYLYIFPVFLVTLLMKNSCLLLPCK